MHYMICAMSKQTGGVLRCPREFSTLRSTQTRWRWATDSTYIATLNIQALKGAHQENAVDERVLNTHAVPHATFIAQSKDLLGSLDLRRMIFYMTIAWIARLGSYNMAGGHDESPEELENDQVIGFRSVDIIDCLLKLFLQYGPETQAIVYSRVYDTLISI